MAASEAESGAGAGAGAGSPPPRSTAPPQRPVALWVPARQWTEERRMHCRIQVTDLQDVQVQLHLGQAQGAVAPLSGRLLNLSAGGCCVAVPSEAMVELRADHLGPGRPCRIGLPVTATGWTSYRARVLRVEGHPSTHRELTLRLRFSRPAPVPQQRLTRWLLQLWLRSWPASRADPAHADPARGRFSASA
jgi:c-di-GMP-binding flagellar brake protein YcgR